MIIESNLGKSTLYGGLLDRCIAKSKFTNMYNRKVVMKGIDQLKKVTGNKNILRLVTSEPVRVCYCNNRTLDCTYNPQPIKVKKGETFRVMIAAVDQVNHTVQAKIHINHEPQDHVRLSRGQEVQDVLNECSKLILNIYSTNNSIKLNIHAEGPCNEKGTSTKKLHITFLPCTCPTGFQQTNFSDDDCQCGCDDRLKPYVTICNQATNTLLRQKDFWINYTIQTNASGYIIYPNCPYDYCLPPSDNVTINVSLSNWADSQCAFNRMGILCSECKPNFSLSLGSSECIPCHNDWPKVLAAIVFGAILAGIGLVVTILFLNLTVAVGSLNGLIFYCNIIGSNSAMFLPLRNYQFFSIFTAWLNLEIGIDTCFYKGMETYSKVWLQFLFPTYLIGVLFIFILVGKHSSRFAKLTGKRNPIATLATLMLLSYTKYIRNIIDIFSAANILYPDG